MTGLDLARVLGLQLVDQEKADLVAFMLTL